VGVKVAAIQMNSRGDKEQNVAAALRLIERAGGEGARLIALPEHFSFLGQPEEKVRNAEPIPGPTTERMAEAAARHGVWLLAGSVLEVGPEQGKCYNTSVLFAPDGREVVRYRKLHLFDAQIGGRWLRESETTEAGKHVVTAETDFGVVGLSICYDLRFPELYRALSWAGAQVMLVPSAFTLRTGKDHWHVLVRARAIENLCYVIAPAQIGCDGAGDETYGHTMVVDPWGTVLAEAPDVPESVVTGELDLDYLAQVRGRLPALSHRRPDLA
jgi:predicted amidohydrolase